MSGPRPLDLTSGIFVTNETLVYAPNHPPALQNGVSVWIRRSLSLPLECFDPRSVLHVDSPPHGVRCGTIDDCDKGSIGCVEPHRRCEHWLIRQTGVPIVILQMIP